MSLLRRQNDQPLELPRAFEMADSYSKVFLASAQVADSSDVRQHVHLGEEARWIDLEKSRVGQEAVERTYAGHYSHTAAEEGEGEGRSQGWQGILGSEAEEDTSVE